MDTLNKVIIIIIACVVCGFVGYLIGRNKTTKYDKDTIIIQDTVYNHTILDSLELRIRYRDSIINKLKVKYEYDVKKVQDMSDSSSVELFKRLCRE